MAADKVLSQSATHKNNNKDQRVGVATALLWAVGVWVVGWKSRQCRKCCILWGKFTLHDAEHALEIGKVCWGHKFAPG